MFLWLCTDCISHTFPFNYITDDNEFNLTMYNFFHFDHHVDINRLLRLKVNPLDFNSIPDLNDCENTCLDSESDTNLVQNCKYTFL